MIHINIRLRLVRKLKNGAHPICFQVTWGKNTRFKTIKGYSCKEASWNFESHGYFHSNRKNGELAKLQKLAQKIADEMEDWDYNLWVSEFNSALKPKEKVEHKKLIAFCRELGNEFIKLGQVPHGHGFINIASFMEKCFLGDIRLRDFGDKELKAIILRMDVLEIKGYGHLNYLKIALTEAMRRDYYSVEQCPIATQYSPKGYNINKRKRKSSKHIKKNRIKDLTEDEKNQVVNYYHHADLPPTQKKHLAYWVLAYKFFGVNFKDIAYIKWTDIVNGYWKYGRAKTGVQNSLGKPAPQEALDILREYDTGGEYVLDVLNGYNSDPERILRRLKNYKANMYKTFKLISKRIGFSDDRYITWNSVRYTAPTIALSKGIDLATVMTMMDHKHATTTDKYAKMVRDRKKLVWASKVL